MRIVLDTNVFVSGIFFPGLPSRILRAWREGSISIVYSSPIFVEYQRVLAEISQQFPSVNAKPILDLVTRHGELVSSANDSRIYCRDPDDVKFINCLVSSKAHCLVTGDKDLLAVRSISLQILTPRQFANRYL